VVVVVVVALWSFLGLLLLRGGGEVTGGPGVGTEGGVESRANNRQGCFHQPLAPRGRARSRHSILESTGCEQTA
jgi:hypothetical protein